MKLFTWFSRILRKIVTNYVLQAMALRSDIIMKKLQNQEIVEFRDRLRNTMAAPVSSIGENRNCNEAHSMNQ